MLNTIVMIPVLFILLLILVGIPVLIGLYVYRDARRRGMNALLWTLVAVLAPSLIGLILYLLIRGSYSDLLCPNCSSPVEEGFTVCPKCGTQLRKSCSRCGFPADNDWVVCPKCQNPLETVTADVKPPVHRNDRSLAKILMLVIVVPLLLLILMIASFSVYKGAGASIQSTNITCVSPGDYADHPHVSEWLAQYEPESGSLDAGSAETKTAYALRYRSGQDSQKMTCYLIYCPAAMDATNVATDTRRSLFHNTLSVSFTKRDDGMDSIPGLSLGDDIAGFSLTCITCYTESDLDRLEVTVNGEKCTCSVMDVDYNPALFGISQDVQ